MAGEDYDALPFARASEMLMVAGVVGVLVQLLVLLSYVFVPTIKAQHPAADVVVWHVACGLMTSLGFVVAYVVEGVRDDCALMGLFNQFFMFASVGWYLMLSLDLFVALVNPWMGYNCKSWTYHTIVWSFSGVSVVVMYQRELYGVSAMNMCWLKRTPDAATVNQANWAFLYGEIVGIFALSLGVLLFASFRFVRRQLDVTYRAKRRNLLQYYRYLLIYGGYWAACGGLYYASYLQSFQGELARRLEVAFLVAFGSYPVLLLVVWVLNTELYQNRSSENALPKSERSHVGGTSAGGSGGAGGGGGSGESPSSSTEHFSAALRKDLMRYTTAGICCSINETPPLSANTLESLKSPLLSRSRANSLDRTAVASLSLLQMEESDSAELYSEKKRLATTVYNNEYRYYEKLGFTDYAPKIFQNIRAVCGIDNERYEQSFADTLLERASEGKSGMLFYFTSDRRYLVKTMTKWEHSFLLAVLPLYHQYVLKQPNSLLCRFLGCHSMQLPVGWNKMFFVVMENVFPDGPVDERYDLKGIFHQSNLRQQEEQQRAATPRWSRRQQQHSFVDMASSSSSSNSSSHSGDDSDANDADEAKHPWTSLEAAGLPYLTRRESEPLLRRGSSRSSLRHDTDFVSRRASLRVNSATRANLLAQVTSDCGFLQELGIMDYSCLLGIRHFRAPLAPAALDALAHNAVVSEDQQTVYYLGFVDILQHYNFGWKVQNCLLSVVLDKRSITALPPAEYALRFLNFIHEYLLRDPDAANKRSYGSVGCSPPLSLTIDRELRGGGRA
ncbi:hypothetical protein PybrP1_003963 [[Pythium] brassicae (nom. inval.)]|nr:hypothetical protein PybrP1_003963 [[Pythium] brassicae (nom. inval.)]